MISQNLDYTADGKARLGYLAYDETRPGRRPAVLVLHEGAGLGEHVRERARRLAGLGYIAFALDLFGGPFESREQGIAVITGMTADPSGVRRHGGEAIELMKAWPQVDPARTAVVGFCFGGWAALEIARVGRGSAAWSVSTAGCAPPGPPGRARSNVRSWSAPARMIRTCLPISAPRSGPR
jgi:dienelactone hydrolase